MSAYRKKLIEVSLPLEAINAASAREKTIRHGHPSTLHLWWARRPLATARAVLFAQLVDDPSSWPDLFPTEDLQNQERQRLFRLIEELVQWDNSASERVINAARLEIARSHARSSRGPKARAVLSDAVKAEVVSEYLATELPPVHDPFAGGGTIPLEAQRLGLRAIAGDLNPVAVIINKALVELPAKFAGLPPISSALDPSGTLRAWGGARGLAADIRDYGKWMREEAKRRIGQLYPEVDLPEEHGGGRATVVAWLWARTVASPDPAHRGTHVPLVSSLWLSKKGESKVWLEPVVERAESRWRFDVRTGVPAHPERLDIGTKAGKAQDFVCLLSGTPIPRTYIRDEGKAGRLGQRLLAIVADGPRKRVYLAADLEHERVAASAEDDDAVREARETLLAGTTPTRAMITGGVCSAYGLTTFGHLFTARQLVALTTFSDLVGVARARAETQATERWAGTKAAILAGGYADAIATYLSFAVSKATTRNCNLALWEPGMGRLAGALGRQALPMVWSFAETNPLAGAGGDIAGTAESVAEVLEALPSGPAGQVAQEDARRPAHFPTKPLVSTDPPYYDNISYAELSDFFYPWLRRTLRPIYPKLFSTVLVPKADELIAAPHRTGSRESAEAFFLQGIKAALEQVARESFPGEPVTIYYAFKQTEQSDEGMASTGWETFLDGLIGSGMQVTATWPIRTELTSALKKDAAVLASSIVLTCRTAQQDSVVITRSDLRRAMRKELPDALRRLQQGNIAPVDIAQASIGPGVAIYSRHRQVVEADGSTMGVRAALQLINEVLDEYLASGEGDFDADTRFAITWYEQHGWQAGSFGDAETLAKARNVSVAGVIEAGIASRAANKFGLLKRDELPAEYDLDADERPTVWEFTQHMIRYLEEQGEEAAARHLRRLGSRADATRELAYRLYNTCERKKWTEDARSYNGLILAWPELEKLAARMTDESPAAAPSRPGKKAKKSKTPTKAQRDLFEGDKK